VTGIRRKGPHERALGLGAKLHYELVRARKEILRYTVQLTVEMDTSWVPVIRYDTAHGSPHKHIYKRDGKERTQAVDIIYDGDLGYQQAAVMAFKDLEENWEAYCAKFRRGVWPT
jgi:hypothetical protein